MSAPGNGTEVFETIVVGAGVAGLAAAATLAEAGRRVAVVEARNRVGGRIYTVPPALPGNLPVELGAEFVHGLPEELIELVDQAALTRFELDGDSRRFHLKGGVGRPEPFGDQREVHQLFDELGHAHLSTDSPDLSFSEFVAQRGTSAEAAAWATNYVEGFNAAEADRISVRSLAKQQAAEDEISGDRLFRVLEGYARVPEFLLRRFREAGGELFQSLPVRSIAWQPGRVELATHTDHVFQAESAIVTLPLGVLQSGSVAFQPEPLAILQAASRLAMGPAARVVYEFSSSKQLAGLEGLSFFFAPEATPPTWWTTSPKPSSMVTGWVAGRKAKQLEAASLPERGLETLSAILGSPISELRENLVSWHMHDWQTDPFSLGAYTYVLRGGIDASDELSLPVEHTLFFAGEHTDTSGHWGTVHGALRSGYRAARQVLGNTG
jgi:monoamine oxidase